MRIVVTGASGNVGSSVVERLAEHPEVTSIVGICRQRHDWQPPRTTWRFLDVADDDLSGALEGADAVIHLAWMFQPVRRPEVTWHNNVEGTQRVLQASIASGVRAVVVASSVGAYAARTSTHPVPETWPTTGVPSAAYSREKSRLEECLEQHAVENPDQRVVVLRPAFTFQHDSASQQRRLFIGPLMPPWLLRRRMSPLAPIPRGLCLQAVHTDDVADAYVAAATGDVRGAFNLAADPVLGRDEIAELLRARPVQLPSTLVRGAVVAAHAARAVPASPGLFDLLQSVPIMDCTRARSELDWRPRHDALDAVTAFLDGIGRSRAVTPPLADRSGSRAHA